MAAAGDGGAVDALLDLYRGSFLAAAPEGASWPFEPRRRLRERLVRALRHCLDGSAAGEDREALQRRALRADPLVEDLHASLVTLLVEQGRRNEAATAFRQGLAALSASAEVIPSPRFLALSGRIDAA
jgi:DNA-binding SARP family transcriptional activator